MTMNKSLGKAILTATVLLLASPASAANGSFTQLPLTQLLVVTGIGGAQVGLLVFGSNASTPNACTTAPRDRMAVNLNTSKGTAIMNLARAALHAKKTLTVSGAGTCNLATGIEDVSTVTVYP